MSPLFIIVFAIIGLIIAVAAVVVLGGVRSRGSIDRSLDMVLLAFELPRFSAESGGGQQRQDKELIAVMEQLYASVSTMRIGGWNKFLYGDPYIGLEIAVHHIGDQISFYAAVPSRYVDQFRQQVHGIFPTAQVANAKEYSIFNPQGFSAGGFLKLKEDPVLPFQTYVELASDPLGPISGALSQLRAEGEGAVVQLLLRPSVSTNLRKRAQDVARHMQGGNDIATALKLAKNPPAQKKDKEAAVVEPPKVATEFEQQVIKSLQSKASRPLFDCDIRILTSASTQERADQMLNDVAGAFAQYAAPNMNSFVLQTRRGRDHERLVYQYAFRIFDENQSIPLSSEEVTSIYHFPTTSAALPKIKTANFKVVEAPAGIPETGVAFGENVYHGKHTMLRLSREDRRRHMYIIGQTGTGKSVTMESMISQDLASGEGITVIDPHGSVAEWVLANIPKERVNDVIYFNPSDVQYPMGLNMLEYDTTNPQDKSLIIDELFEIMAKLFDLSISGGPQFERYFKNAVFLLLDNYERRVPTLADMSRVFTDEAFRNELLAHETNQIVKQFWELEASKTTGEQSLVNFAGYVTSKVDTFTNNDFLRPIINQTTSAINFKDVIENKKILVVNLAKGKIGDLNGNLLGMVVVGKLRRAALARDTSRGDLPDHYVYMDEFHSITAQSINVILAEARKYHLCLIMAHQFIKQLDENIRDSVFGNVGTMCIYRVSPEDAENPAIKTKFEPMITPYDISNIDNFNAYVSMLVNGQVGRPCNARTLTELVFDRGDARMRESVIQINRLRLGRPHADVEAEIQQRFASKTN